MTDDEVCRHSVVDMPIGKVEFEMTQRLPMVIWDMGGKPERVVVP
jgi:hypothetical protein